MYSLSRKKLQFGILLKPMPMVVLLFLGLVFQLRVWAATPLTAEDILKMQYVTSAKISPDGQWVAYTRRVPRKATDEPGSAYSELHVLSLKTGESFPFITGKVNVHGIEWRPDGSSIAFLMSRGKKAKTQVWMIPLAGGEAIQITHSPTSVSEFHWNPNGEEIGYLAVTPPSKKEKFLKEKGFHFIYFEEDWKHRNLYVQKVGKYTAQGEPRQITHDITIWSFVYAPDGATIAVSASEKNLIDYRYMFRKVYLLKPGEEGLQPISQNEGKLGNFQFSPDGRFLVYTAASRRSDHAVSQVYVVNLETKEVKNLTEPQFRGHVTWAGWKDNGTIVYLAAEGVWNTLNTVSRKGGSRKIILHGKDVGIVFNPPSFTPKLKQVVFVGQSSQHPREVFYWKKKSLVRLTDSNPWLKERLLGKQEVIHYPARDGVEIEGILIYPVDYQPGQKYPLIVSVHGGPESHYTNGWLSYYFQPGQVLAGRGYAVFYPNYRASTGYGVEFAMKWHYNNPAGTEFDDVADGIDYLIKSGIADRDRVGLGGGSYGGFAAAWFATYYTKKVKAVCMFVGISDLISKRGTTDIPYEELYVHSGKKLEEMWDLSLKRSPIYWAHQSQTAVLILGGTADTRVHPSQSLEMYRRLKMNDHPAVRLVQYPGEGHGNRRQPGRIDVLYRTLQWYDWYVKERHPLSGPMPPVDISDKYGLDLPQD